ncbi:hypothetical protein [Lentilactobacillus buchneri]|nr:MULTISPECIES: hypothetical protein [Lentilactobacillus]MCC6100984.1 hypothetical protein [Lactobacillus sp.]MCV3742039.1 hypothetical protein [Lentilactobacillus hilgardii]
MDRATTGITTTKQSSIAESLTIDMLSGNAVITNHPKIQDNLRHQLPKQKIQT